MLANHGAGWTWIPGVGGLAARPVSGLGLGGGILLRWCMSLLEEMMSGSVLNYIILL